MLKAGTVIGGKYKILSVLGRGGMSVVYLAINERANKPWAVKEIIRRDFHRFQVDKKEIELMKRLSNPHLPSIVDVIEQDGGLLIVMDYVEGRSLEALLLESGAQKEERVIDWGIQLCEVLSYLHRQQPPVVYRDMKPANVMVKPDGTLVLIDLGAAREYKPQSLKDTVSLGTMGYAAPEQYEETGQSDARTDIYCLGVMLFQLLTGENPHHLQPVRGLRPELSEGIETILCKCTRVRKEERYQSCAELSYALEHCREQDAAYRRRQKKKLAVFAAVLSTALLLGGGAVLCLEAEKHIRRSSYEARILAASKAADKEEELSCYEQAIALSPGREEAWLGFLEEGCLDDGRLTAGESQRLRALLIQYADETRTNEMVFRTNEEGYARFAYRAGIAYFYQFEERSNKKNARGYFQAAAESQALEEGQRERARRLCLISEYYAGIGLADEAGDVSVTGRDYWEDLTELSAGNLVELDNERTALVMYRELVGQILARASEFLRAGVTKEELYGQLQEVRLHLHTDFEEKERHSGVVSAEIQAEKEALLELTKRAERILDSSVWEAEQRKEAPEKELLPEEK